MTVNAIAKSIIVHRTVSVIVNKCLNPIMHLKPFYLCAIVIFIKNIYDFCCKAAK